ncbi:MAG TPA: serine/threonine-protein kinase, partial [Pirellulales bacterium]
AKFMMDSEWITRWQARQLLEKRSDFSLGTYSLIDLIGRGATGNVYKARTKGGQIVALKVLNPDLMKKPEAVARFQREMRIAAALNHPHIVTAYDTGQLGDDTHFIAMEYVEGRDLKSWLNQLGALPIAWACECVKQAALGLQHAHEQGIVHRDIKPGNLLVVSESVETKPFVKVLDLGFANAARKDLKRNSLTKADQLLGTPDYMSPEQAEDPTSADIRSDIYSLGATLFRLLANRPPFLGNNPIEKLHARLRDEAPLVRQFRPDVPQKLEAIIAKMLARSVSARFNEPKDVVEALEPFSMTVAAPQTHGDPSSFLQELTVEVVAPAAEPTWRKWLAGALAVGGVLAGAGAAVTVNPMAGISAAAIGLLGAALAYPRKSTFETAVAAKRRGKSNAGIDLLTKVDPVRDRVSGEWTSSENVLTSPAEEYARIKIPLNLPVEYTLRATVVRREGVGPLVLGLVVGRSQCFITVDGWGGTLSGLGLIGGRPYDANPTTFKGHILNDGQPTELIVEVTEMSVRLLADGMEILAWRGDADHLSLFRAWEVPDRQWLFIGAHGCVYEIPELRLVPNSPMPQTADEPA